MEGESAACWRPVFCAEGRVMYSPGAAGGTEGRSGGVAGGWWTSESGASISLVGGLSRAPADYTEPLYGNAWRAGA